MKLVFLIHCLGIAQGCLLPHERLAARSASPSVPTAYPPALPVGTGDRFKGGKKAPVGLGFDDRDLETTLSLDEIKSGLKGLAKAYDDVDFFTLPHKTHEKRSTYGVSIGEPRVYLNAGIHARERGGPDIVLYFVGDLLRARKARTGLKYGTKTYTFKEVTKALSAGVVIVPVSNPDGVAYDQATNTCWRRNRNPASADPDDPTTIGVDLNRNFDFLWDFRNLFNMDMDKGPYPYLPAADDPADEFFHGTSPNSEPEAKNVDWILREFDQLSWFLDLHSVGPDILYSWGDDTAQSTHPEQNFLNPDFDDLRGQVQTDGAQDPNNGKYGEYMEAADLASQKHIAERMASTMASIAPSPLFEYQAFQPGNFFSSSGATNDYATSGYYGRKCGANRIQGLGLEFGVNPQEETDCGTMFYPNSSMYHTSIRQVGIGFMELLLWAAGAAGEKKTYEGKECDCD